MTDKVLHPQDVAAHRRTVALGCRVLALAGLTEDVLGHVSVRVGTDRMLVRCRGPEERGLLFTRDVDVHEVDLDGSGDLPDGYAVPNELPLHGELMRARPDVGSVVHVHPPSVVLADLAGLSLRPVVGAYHLPAHRMARRGVPVYPRSVLVSTSALGREVAVATGEAEVCVLRGHGAVSVGSSVEQAVVRALTLDRLARLTVDLARLGGRPDVVPERDAELLPDLGSGFDDTLMWRHHLARLARAGLADPAV